MPRNGSGVATPVPGTDDAVPNTTIESSKYDSLVADIYDLFNTAWPTTLGGTGGTSVISSWDSLSAKGADIASAGTINLTTATGARTDITGVTTITAVTMPDGAFRIARATGIFQLTASATLVVNKSTSVNYTTAVGDLLFFYRDGSAVSVTAVGSGGSTFATRAQANAQTSTVLAVPPAYLFYPTGHLFGCTLSNNVTDATNDIDIAVGTARSADDTYNINLTSALTKRLDATWAVGTNQGFLASGAAITNTTYHIFLILRPDTGVVDVAADTSVTGANIAANTNAAYTQIRRIGSIIRSGGAILPFVQIGDRFRLSSAIIDVDAATPGTSAVTRTLTTPSGLVTRAIIVAGAYFLSARTSLLVSPLTSVDQAPQAPNDTALVGFSQVASASDTGTGGWNFSGEILVATNTSSQVRSRASSAASSRISITTFGWEDTRGTV